MRHAFVLTTVLLCASTRIVPGQDSSSHVSDRAIWSVALRAGLSHSLEEGVSGAPFAAGVGVRRRLGRSGGLSAEVGYAGLGHSSRQNPSLTPFPESAPATAIHRLRESLISLGVSGDLDLSRGSVRPRLLAGLAWARVRSTHQEILVDTTGQRVDDQRFTNTRTRVVLMFGLGIGFPPIRGVQPALEARYHTIPIREDDGTEHQQFLTLGVSLGF